MNSSTDADSLALAFLGTLSSLADEPLRIAWLRNECASRPAGFLAEILEAVATGADAGVADYRRGLLQLAVAIAPPEFDAIRREAAAYAIVHHLDAARGLLVPDSTDQRDAAETRSPPLVPGRTVTLGERKSFARRSTPEMLEKLVHDPDPNVIRILLSNPTVRESDVLRIAAKRPIPAEVLREILVHPRWSVRYTIRFALVQNPYLPTNLGLALVRSLHRQDAFSIVQSTELPESIRNAARADLQRLPHH